MVQRGRRVCKVRREDGERCLPQTLAHEREARNRVAPKQSMDTLSISLD